MNAAISRETIQYSANVFRHDLPAIVELLSDSIRNIQITPETLLEVRENLELDIANLSSKPETVIPELLHMAAYDEKGLGNSLLSAEGIVANISQEAIEDYVRTFFVPEGVVLAAAGANHLDLVSLARKHLGDMPATNRTLTNEPSVYSGGERRVPEEGLPFVHLALGFEGVSYNDPDFFAVSTLQTLLGGGSSFSSGGPGKGMNSRLYTRVLNGYEWVESATAINFSYTDTGMFGIQGACVPRYADEFLSVLCRELKHAGSKIGEEELGRAKNQLKSMLLINLEMIAIQCEDIGRQVQTFGHRVSPAELCARIEAVTVGDVMRATRRLLAAKPTLVSLGDIERVPRLHDVARHLR